MTTGAVVLAGGRSSRMGTAKALLDWHGRPAVTLAVATVCEGIGGGPVCVVRAPGQDLPLLDALVVDDPVAHGGPLVGLLAGLDALGRDVEVAFACGVDTPLHWDLIRLASLLTGRDLVDEGRTAERLGLA